jgi:hypothetical protein
MKTEADCFSGTLPPTKLHGVISEKATVLICLCHMPEITAEVFNYHSGYFRFFRYSDWLLLAGRPRGRSSLPVRDKFFLLSTSSVPALGPTQRPIQWVPGAHSQLTTHQLMPRSRKRGSIHPLAHTSLWHSV